MVVEIFGHLLCKEVEEVILDVLLELVWLRDKDLFVVSLVVHDILFLLYFRTIFYLNLKLFTPKSILKL